MFEPVDAIDLPVDAMIEPVHAFDLLLYAMLEPVDAILLPVHAMLEPVHAFALLVLARALPEAARLRGAPSPADDACTAPHHDHGFRGRDLRTSPD